MNPKVQKALEGLKPTNDHIFIQRDEVTKSTIALPDKTRENLMPRTATVLAVGPGALRVFSDGRFPMSCKVGDRVIYGNTTTFRVDPQDETTEICICRDSDLIAVLPPE